MKKTTQIEFLEKSSKKHDDKYDYSLLEYRGVEYKIKIICPEHGMFEKTARDHVNGQGCPSCSKKEKYSKFKLSKEELIKDFNKKHNNKYDYSLVEYENLKKNIKIICPEHGVFEQRPAVHLNGNGCKKCFLKKRGFDDRLTTEEFIEKAKKLHGEKYDYSLSNYTKNTEYLKIICKKHGEFEQMAQAHLHGSGCPKCSFVVTKPVIGLVEFLKNLNIEISVNDREIINGKELDIFIPSHNIAIEFNGLYWHSELFVSPNYHLNKTELCEKQNIQLIHIFEDEWTYKQDIVKSRLKNLLGLTENKIFARKCIIKEIDKKVSKTFIEANHIQGGVNSKINLGLYHGDELVSVMTFGDLRKSLGSTSKQNHYELLRFCNKLNTNVVGGADKLLQHFIKTYKPIEIISYADRRWSKGDLYEKLGFSFFNNSKPNYWYIFGKTRKYRFGFRKSMLVKEGFDKNKTEHQIMLERGINRIYDCGTKKFIKIFS